VGLLSERRKSDSYGLPIIPEFGITVTVMPQNHVYFMSNKYGQ